MRQLDFLVHVVIDSTLKEETTPATPEEAEEFFTLLREVPMEGIIGVEASMHDAQGEAIRTAHFEIGYLRRVLRDVNNYFLQAVLPPNGLPPVDPQSVIQSVREALLHE